MEDQLLPGVEPAAVPAAAEGGVDARDDPGPTGQQVHLFSAAIVPMRWLDVVGGWGMATFTCALVGLYLWRTRNEDFDLPPTR